MNIVDFGLLVFMAICFLGSAFFSASETAFFSLSPFQVGRMEREGRPHAGLVRTLLADPHRLLNGVLLGNLFVNTAVAATSVLLLHRHLTAVALPASLLYALDVVGVTLVLLVLGEVTPKTVALERSSSLTQRTAPLLTAWLRALDPVIQAAAAISRGAARALGGGEGRGRHTPEELRAAVEAGAVEGEIDKEEREIITSLLSFGTTTAREVMVPRIHMVCAEEAMSVEEFLRLARASEHSRIPLYRGIVDNITGIVHAKDLLGHVYHGEPVPRLRDLAREPLFIPESKRIADLLGELQRSRLHMAIVVDEYGGTAGLVTLEDILEEIVGEIQDEYDIEEPNVKVVEDGVYLVNGLMDVDDLGEVLGVPLEGEGFETLGGYIYALLGRIPRQGEEVEAHGWTFRVEKVIRRRIARVRIERSVESAPPAVEGAQ